MENPVRRIREDLRMSRRQLCHAARVRLDELYLAENGLIERPQKRLMRFLEQAGYDRNTILNDYGVYRAHLQAIALADATKTRQGGAVQEPETSRQP